MFLTLRRNSCEVTRKLMSCERTSHPRTAEHALSPVASSPGYLCSQSLCRLEGLSDSSYVFSQHPQGLRPGPRPDHRWSLSCEKDTNGKAEVHHHQQRQETASSQTTFNWHMTRRYVSRRTSKSKALHTLLKYDIDYKVQPQPRIPLRFWNVNHRHMKECHVLVNSGRAFHAGQVYQIIMSYTLKSLQLCWLNIPQWS